jgi:hypothetical protein
VFKALFKAYKSAEELRKRSVSVHEARIREIDNYDTWTELERHERRAWSRRESALKELERMIIKASSL